MGVFYLEIYDKYLAFVGLGRECGENKKDLNCEENYFSLGGRLQQEQKDGPHTEEEVDEDEREPIDDEDVARSLVLEI